MSGSKLPVVRSRELMRALKRAGFQQIRQTGSHVMLECTSNGRTAVVPSHAGDVKLGTLRSVLKQSGLSSDDLRRLLRKR